MYSDIEIAQRATLKPVNEIASRLGIPPEALDPYGHYKAKISLDYINSLKSRPDGKLILVTAMSPTPAGEGKTTTTVGLGDALNRIGKKTVICLREPSLGPVFGMKGGAAGGGYAQVVPMEDINLHFTGDFGAIALANNLLAALLDNHIDVVLFTAAVQVHHLMQVATEMNFRDPLIAALQRTMVASIGPVTSEALAEFGIPVRLEPTHPKMGFLVKEAAAEAMNISGNHRP